MIRQRPCGKPGQGMESFREIVPTQAMTRLPGAPSTVCGLMNLRGTIVTVLDGGTALRTPLEPAEKPVPAFLGKLDRTASKAFL